ncbi:MAG TPA: protein kinase [Candidatus Nanoarchaeia archaeon]|nr:protein kinase [Candidatus Nanoarchaeia archaeon]
MEFLGRGKRGEVFLTTYNGKPVVVKQVRASSTALGRLENEADWLRKLNKHHIGPSFITLEDGKLFMEYVRGVSIGEYLEQHPFTATLAKEILDQCRVLDTLHVNKLEMHHPTKHILVKRGKLSRKTVVMIDFERCRWTEKPKNVTQFVQFLQRYAPYDKKDVNVFLKNYKEQQDMKTYTRLVAALFA